MKIRFEAHKPQWKVKFQAIRDELSEAIGFLDPHIEHIGSTSVEGLSAKPIIDILVGLKDPVELDRVVQPLMEREFIYYEIYNSVMPYRRLFVKLDVAPESLSLPSCIKEGDKIPQPLIESNHNLSNIHVMTYGTEHWIRHIAFRNYLRRHPDTMKSYGDLKSELSRHEWVDTNEYNAAKDPFIKLVEKAAIQEYHEDIKGL